MREYTFKYRYGISLEKYDQMFKDQNGCCKICSDTPLDNKRLYVDHCHTSGDVRGLLCQKCNTGLGMFRDNEEFLIKAINYLKGEV